MTTKDDLANVQANQILQSRTVCAVPTLDNLDGAETTALKTADRIRKAGLVCSRLSDKATGAAATPAEMSELVALAIVAAAERQLESDRRALELIVG